MPAVTVSVITPCYNGARYLAETLESAVRQTHAPLEVIVVDDGSTDDSAAIAERADPPVRVIRQDNHGESAARNRALAEARGTHVLFLDADDLLAPEALARLAVAVEGRAGAVAVMGAAWFTTEPSTPDHVKTAVHTSFYPEIVKENIAPPHAWLAPADLVRHAGGFAEDMRWFEDWDLWWRVGLEARALVPVPYVGALYRQHPASQLATTRLADRTRGHAVLMTRMARALLDRPDLLEAHGEPLFWGMWTAAVRARRAGIGWAELAPLTAALGEIARRGPNEVRALRSARAFRWLGVRTSMAFLGGA